MITATLFDGLTVSLVPESLEYGDNWRMVDGQWQVYQPGVLKWVYEQAQAQDAPILFDVGASTGVCALLAAHVPGLHVWAFEPNPALVDILRANLEANGIADRVTVCDFALGDRFARTKLHVPTNQKQAGLAVAGGTPKRYADWRDIPVDVWPMDAINATPTIVKIDVEGGELGVLWGGAMVLQTMRPCMVLEVDTRNTAQFDYEPLEITKTLARFRYQWAALNKDNVVAWAL